MASRSTRGGPKGEDGKTVKMGEHGWEEGMSGGKAVPVVLMKAASPRSREGEDQRRASWSNVEKSWR